MKTKTRTAYSLLAALLMVAAVMTTGGGAAKAAGNINVGGIGVITGSDGDSVNLRSGPGTAYDVNVKLSEGQAVEVYDGPRTDKAGNVWYKVRNENGGGWVVGDYLANKGSVSSTSVKSSAPTTSTQQASSTGSAAKIKIGGAVKVTDDNLRIRSKASKSGDILATVDSGAVLKVMAGPATDKAGNTWYEVSGKYTVGWVVADYLAATKSAPPVLVSSQPKASSDTRTTTSRGGSRDTNPAPQQAAPQQPAAQQLAPQLAAHVSEGNTIVAIAKQYLGSRYRYGGSSPRGFDCSGFTSYVLGKSGIGVGRSADAQFNDGTHVKASQLQPGDIVFFANTYKAGISHVGIYIGNGQFIHAESSDTGVVISDLWSSYYAAHYYGAVRVTN